VGLAGDDRDGLGDVVDRIAAEEGLSGVIRVDLDGSLAVQRAYGLAHRGLGVPTTVDTQFSVASGSKGLTALTVMSLVERGELGLDTTARSVLGADLPLIDDRVTVEQLLAHRSGIGDYLDEDELDDNNDYVLTVPVHELATTEQFLAVLDGHPMKHEPGARFVYCNGGYVVLALLAERTTGVPFHDLVDQRVCRPAGMTPSQQTRRRSTASMPASVSSPSAIATDDSATPCCPTRPAGHGRSVNASASCSQHRRDQRRCDQEQLPEPDAQTAPGECPNVTGTIPDGPRAGPPAVGLVNVAHDPVRRVILVG
jgi:CubicO group peptidase (beta-lactamase class C family)